MCFLGSSSQGVMSAMIERGHSPQECNRETYELYVRLKIIFAAEHENANDFVYSEYSHATILRSLAVAAVSMTPRSAGVHEEHSVVNSPRANAENLNYSAPSYTGQLPSPTTVATGLVLSVSGCFCFSSGSCGFLL